MPVPEPSQVPRTPPVEPPRNLHCCSLSPAHITSDHHESHEQAISVNTSSPSWLLPPSLLLHLESATTIPIMIDHLSI